MEQTPRHQCLIYDGSPAKMLPAIAAMIKQRLSENQRCFYLNSPAMVAGLRSYLFAAGVDVPFEVARTSLILTSDQSQLKNGRFEMEKMLGMLEDAVKLALIDGFTGLWATGDMTWELGPNKNLQTLLDYERGLEKLFQRYPALSGICQYHADTMPRELTCNGLLVHPAIYINQTLTRLNPHYIPAEAAGQPAAVTPELKHVVQNLCALQPREDMER
jgi:hypothetical protein